MTASELISRYIAEFTDWRGIILARIRKVFHDADPAIIEEWKWMGSPVWSPWDKVKLTFSQGVSLPDHTKSSMPALEAINGEPLISTKTTKSTNPL